MLESLRLSTPQTCLPEAWTFACSSPPPFALRLLPELLRLPVCHAMKSERSEGFNTMSGMVVTSELD